MVELLVALTRGTRLATYVYIYTRRLSDLFLVEGTPVIPIPAGL